ncbi:MAG: hypothetical protein AB1815_05015 [Bacillota bacterium]|jgi:hypothetical protein
MTTPPAIIPIEKTISIAVKRQTSYYEVVRQFGVVNIAGVKPAW